MWYLLVSESLPPGKAPDLPGPLMGWWDPGGPPSIGDSAPGERSRAAGGLRQRRARCECRVRWLGRGDPCEKGTNDRVGARPPRCPDVRTVTAFQAWRSRAPRTGDATTMLWRTAELGRRITDARCANEMYSYWGVSYTAGAQLIITLDRATSSSRSVWTSRMLLTYCCGLAAAGSLRVAQRPMRALQARAECREILRNEAEYLVPEHTKNRAAVLSPR